MLALRQFLPPDDIDNPVYVRSGENFFCSTLHMCLKGETPTILLETEFTLKTVVKPASSNSKQVFTVNTVDMPVIEDEDEYRGDGDLAQAFVSAQGTIEGWLYKTSQSRSLF